MNKKRQKLFYCLSIGIKIELEYEQRTMAFSQLSSYSHKMSNVINALELIQLPSFGVLKCHSCRELYEPVCEGSKFCSSACDKEKSQHSYADETSLLIERNVMNSCTCCNKEVQSLCKMDFVFCSSWCYELYTQNYYEEEEDTYEEDTWEPEEVSEEVPEECLSREEQILQKKMKEYYKSRTNAC
jgi:hypothetical protein